MKGPTVKIKISCQCGDCEYKSSEKYTCQSDWGYDHYCNHPDFSEKKYIGETGTPTPDFCPFKQESLEVALNKFKNPYKGK